MYFENFLKRIILGKFIFKAQRKKEIYKIHWLEKRFVAFVTAFVSS